MLSFFEIPLLGKNRPGTDSIHRLSLLIPDENALTFFKKRLESFGITWEPLIYLNQSAISFKDIDGLEVILLVNNNYKTPNAWRKNPYTQIPERYQILGMGPVELRVKNAQATLNFLKETLAYTQRQDMAETVMTLDEKGLYTDFVVVEQQGERARPGQGYIHHIAVNTPKSNDLNAVYQTINQQPGNNSGIIDRYFFESLYYRQNHILYEFATADPGFTLDTSIKNLGKHLNLPDFMEDRRTEIENNLHEL